ncbi:YggS family pyridoxal phosphate-dependent enzyme [Polluticoccus soli]|uniref:YggS family pyridoxal phosphate-dependent enzyme n=1 Tax=Polluticoccus soli TaxID=3034150 RepID=UPI0023E23AFB|nr:YggS family pyridoxal phosphate-dependent enzyme [Flavipsychrobacter sp. JY13-12]
MVNEAVWKEITAELKEKNITLVAVSKTKPVSDIQDLYNLGQRDFGENYVQELVEKQPQLPADVQWHYIGHLQSNKVKYIAPFVHLIHAVDSFKLLLEINKQAAKNDRVIDVLLQMHVAEEETKFGLDEKELIELLEYYTAQKDQLSSIRVCGLMGMATNTEDESVVRLEYKRLHNTFNHLKDVYFINQPQFNTCSIGMSSDYKIAMEEGSTMVRIGSLLFGARQYN